MKKSLYLPLFLLLAISLTGCLVSNNQLEATNQALNNQLSTQSAQLTQPSGSSSQPTAMAPTAVPPTAVPPTQGALPTVPPTALPPTQPAVAEGVVAPTLIVSGSGEIFPWSNNTPYAMGLFGTANVRLVCAASDTVDGKVWIDDKTYTVSCNPNSESWTPWKADITIGDHYIYSQNAADKYEFWTIGTTPFTIHNTREGTDFMFNLPTAGIYNLTTKVTKGAFNVYITCEGAQNFNYNIIQSTTIQVVLSPARCEMIIRDSPPGTLTPGEIDVSLEFSQ